MVKLIYIVCGGGVAAAWRRGDVAWRRDGAAVAAMVAVAAQK